MRELPQFAAIIFMFVGEAEPRISRIGIETRYDAGIVGVSFLGQHIEHPKVGRGTQTLRNAVSDHPLSTCYFQCVSGTASVIAKFFPSHLPYIAVVEAVVCDLVSLVGNLRNQVGTTLSNPA